MQETNTNRIEASFSLKTLLVCVTKLSLLTILAFPAARIAGLFLQATPRAVRKLSGASTIGNDQHSLFQPTLFVHYYESLPAFCPSR